MSAAERQRRRRRKLRRERPDPKRAAKIARRAERLRLWAGRVLAAPEGKHGIIVEDFEWDQQTWSENGKDRHASNTYLTSTDAHTAEEIVRRTADRFRSAADDCLLFKWTTIPHLAITVDVLRLRGFRYSSNYVWHKQGHYGMGFWGREVHEHLLIGVRGKVVAPLPGTQFDSLVKAPKPNSLHSSKPELFLEWIERLYPDIPKLELNRRGPPRSGWDAWGDEASKTEAGIGRPAQGIPR